VFTRVEYVYLVALVKANQGTTIAGINQDKLIHKLEGEINTMDRLESKKQSLPKLRQAAKNLPPIKRNLNKAKNEGKFRLKQTRLTPRNLIKGDMFRELRKGKNAPKVIIDLFMGELTRCNIISERYGKQWTKNPDGIYFRLVEGQDFKVHLKWTESSFDFIYWFEKHGSTRRNSLTRYLRVYKESIEAKYNGNFKIKYVWLKELTGALIEN